MFKRAGWIGLGVAVGLVVGSAAYAVVINDPNPGDRYYACVSPAGLVRSGTIKRNTPPTKCPSANDQVHSWNAVGNAGPTGATGAPGAAATDYKTFVGTYGIIVTAEGCGDWAVRYQIVAVSGPEPANPLGQCQPLMWNTQYDPNFAPVTSAWTDPHSVPSWCPTCSPYPYAIAQTGGNLASAFDFAGVFEVTATSNTVLRGPVEHPERDGFEEPWFVTTSDTYRWRDGLPDDANDGLPDRSYDYYWTAFDNAQYSRSGPLDYTFNGAIYSPPASAERPLVEPHAIRSPARETLPTFAVYAVN